VYGMNFRFMPELAWHWGYPVIWGVMIAIVVGLLLFFRRRGWM
jgi:magnesium transporter